MDLTLLRNATRPEHEATESTVSLTGPDLTRAEYISVLQRFYDLVLAWDTVAARETPADLAALVQARRRSASLAADLAYLGDVAPAAPPVALVTQMEALLRGSDRSAPEADRSRFLGAMYVLEGSTLGGRYIAAHVERVLELQPGLGDRFFRGYEQQTMPMWREFQAQLVTVPPELGDTVITAAKGMFGIFGAWLALPAGTQFGTAPLSAEMAG